MSEHVKKKCLPIVFILFLIGVWQGIVRWTNVPAYIVPAPSDVVKTLFGDFHNILPHIQTTLYECLVGYICAILLSLVLAVCMDLIPPVKQALYPVLIITQTIPTIALAPILIIWFGFGSLPKIIVVILTCFFPIVISLVEGLGSVEQDMIQHFRLMGASKVETFFHLKLPYGFIHFFSGLKIAATYSVMGAVIGEWLGGNKGLGVYMTRARSTYALDKLFAAILVIMVLSIVLVEFIGMIERISMPWNRGVEKKKEQLGG